jgi:penicillin-binding protein 1A
MFENLDIRRSIRKWLYMFLGLLSFFAILTSLGVGILLGYVKSLPPIEQLENYSPPQMTDTLDRTDRTVIGKFYRENRVVVPLGDIPQNVVNAFLAIEDKRFYQHFGVDFARTLKALMTDIRHMRAVQGGSTITQQLPRNLLPEVGRRKVVQRKVKELLLALEIEQRYSKDQILEFYLNQIYLGNGAYGVQAAARTFFNKDVKDLTLSECATLAGIPRSPLNYSPLNNLKQATARRNLVLALMRDDNMIDEEQYEKTVREPLVVQPREPRPNKAPYFTEFVRQEIEEKTGITAEELRQQRYVIHSTLDTELQNIAEQELKKDLREVELLWQKNKYARFLEEGEKFQDQPLQKGQVRLAKISQVFSDSVIVELEGYRAHVELPDPLPYYEPKNVIKVGGYLDIEVQDVDHEKNTFAATAYDQGRIQGAILVLDAHTGHILAMVGGEEFYDHRASNRSFTRRRWSSATRPRQYSRIRKSSFRTATLQRTTRTNSLDRRPCRRRLRNLGTSSRFCCFNRWAPGERWRSCSGSTFANLDAAGSCQQTRRSRWETSGRRSSSSRQPIFPS